MFEAAILGTIGRDGELKTSQAGKPFCSIPVAVGNGDQTTWVGCAVFGDRAKELAPELVKGAKVYCEGRVKVDGFVDKSGKERLGLSLACWSAEILGRIGKRRP